MSTALCRVPVEEDALIYMQQLTFELDGLRVLNAQIACSESAKVEWQERYLRAYAEKCAEYQFAFAELTRELAPAYAGGGYRGELDFFTGKLTLYRGDAHGIQ